MHAERAMKVQAPPIDFEISISIGTFFNYDIKEQAEDASIILHYMKTSKKDLKTI